MLQKLGKLSHTVRAASSSRDMAADSPRCRHVTTAFVQRPDGKVLLVLRSAKVGTYQGLYGGVSGGMENTDESPLFRAQQEVLEEVGIPASLLHCARVGRPLLVDDRNRHFCVHPFLFSLAAPHEVTLNWENDAAEWVAPAGIRSLGAVPQLAETYERVHLTEAQAAAVARLVGDRQHGAAELAHWAVEALQQDAETQAASAAAAAVEVGLDQEDVRGAECMVGFRNFGWHLATCRPAMASIANAVAAVLAGAHEQFTARADARNVPVQEVYGIVQSAAATELERLDDSAVALQRQVAGLLRDGTTLMTTSLSSTVLQAVKEVAAGQIKLQAIVCEARPLFEGVQTAAAWAEAGIDVTLITDAQAGLFVGQADMVLVGADAITSQAAVNKAGTYLLALAAHAAKVPVYAAADTGKLSPGTLAALVFPGAAQHAGVQEEMAVEEISAAWGQPVPQGVHVRNLYFEDIPLDLLSAVVTEEGPLDRDGIAQRLEQQWQQYRTAFQLP